MKRIIYTGKILTVAVIVLLLGACILQPEAEKTGSITIGFSAAGVSGNELGASSTTTDRTYARVWLYANGTELRTATVPLSGGRTVRFESVPEGGGYSLVAVVGDMDSDVLKPGYWARTSEPFSVSGGRETTVPLSASAVESTYDLIGRDLSSVVRVGSDVFAATSSSVFKIGSAGAVLNGSVNRVSPGLRPDSSATVFANMNDGIRYWNGSTFEVVSQEGENPPIENIQDSGAFIASAVDQELDADELVIYYSRLGGLGGVTTTVGSIEWEWGDSGDEMEDLIAPDQNPIRTMATDGSNAAYIASVLGTFKMTRDFLSDENDDLDIGGLLGGDSDDAQGLTFFGVAYPGSDRPMRIARIGLVEKRDLASGAENNRIIVGTGRGAFYFDGDAVDDLTDTGLIKRGNVQQISEAGIPDQAVLDISVSGDRVAIATRETIAVVDARNPNTVIFSIPSRAVALGRPRNVFLYGDGSVTTLYVAGDQGLTTLQVETR